MEKAIRFTLLLAGVCIIPPPPLLPCTGNLKATNEINARAPVNKSSRANTRLGKSRVLLGSSKEGVNLVPELGSPLTNVARAKHGSFEARQPPLSHVVRYSAPVLPQSQEAAVNIR